MAQRSLFAETETLNQVLRLLEAFKAFDANNDGLINAAELGGILGSLGYNKTSGQDVRTLMEQGDSNKDGFLSTEEFIQMFTKNMELTGGFADFLATCFHGLDLEGEEWLTSDELHEVISNQGSVVPREYCKAIIAAMDVGRDGCVPFEDFKLIVSSFL